MSKRELLTPFVVAALTLAFLFVCAMVVLSANDPAWVRRKLRIGALLLGLTAVTTTGCGTTCYAPIEPGDYDTILPDEFSVAQRTINLAETDVVTVAISRREADELSYRLEDDLGQEELARGDLEPVDGALDEPDEEFEITLPALDPGNYLLKLFTTNAADQTTHRLGVPLTIINE